MRIGKDQLQECEKLIVEVGCGDGKLLYDLSKEIGGKTYFIGIEKDISLFKNCCLLVPKNKNNLLFINALFEQTIDEFPENVIDTIIFVLPPPKYIDQGNKEKWIPIYRMILRKIKKKGRFIMLTEYTDPLLSPVSVNDYIKWKNWIITTFTNLGFKLAKEIDGIPEGYSSHFIQKFKNDPYRIKILTLYLEKD